MFKAIYHQDFKKDYKKLQQGKREIFAQRLLLFLKNPDNSLIKDHLLKGLLKGRRAFSVTGDIRVVYRFVDKKTVLLLRIGTHNQVY